MLARSFVWVTFFSIGLDNVLLHGWHDTQIYEVRAVFCARVCVLCERVCVCMLIVETPKPFYIYAYRYKHTCTPCIYINWNVIRQRTDQFNGRLNWNICLRMYVREYACMHVVDIVISFFIILLKFRTQLMTNMTLAFHLLGLSLSLQLTLSTNSYDFSPSLFQTIQNQMIQLSTT